MNRNFRFLIGALTCASLSTSFGTAAAAETIKLRVADSLPAGHYAAEQGIKPWMASVKRATAGAVEFEYFPAEQLGKAKDLLSLTLSGVVDVGYIQAAYVSDKLPLSAIVELPGIFQSSCVGTAAYWKIAKDGILTKSELEPNRVQLLFAVVLAPYQAFLAKRRIEGVRSFEGMKMRTAGGTQDLMLRKLKGVPVRVAGPEMYEAVSRGTADGVILPPASVLSYDLQKLVKYGTVGESFGTTAITYMISDTKWKSLPAGVQKAMLAIGEEASMNTCAYIDRENGRVLDKLRQAGVEMTALPEADRRELRSLLATTGTEWAEAMDKRGKPGTQVLKAFVEAAKPAQ